MRVPFLVFSLALVVSAHAQLFPPVPNTGTVYDGARLLSVADVRTLERISQEFKAREGAPIVIATLPSLESVGAKDLGIERYAAALFDQWRIGHKERNVGILLLVARADHKVRVELGKDLGHDYDAKVHEIQGATILTAFRRGDYAGGIVAGAEALSHLPDSSPAPMPPGPPMQSAETSQNVPPYDAEPAEQSDGSLPLVGLLCLGLPILVFVAIIVGIVHRRRSYSTGRYDPNFRPGPSGTFTNRASMDSGDDGFTEGLITGQIMSQPTYDPTYDPGPAYDASPLTDPTPSYDPGPSFDSGSSSDSGGSFDSGSSGGGGDTGSW